MYRTEPEPGFLQAFRLFVVTQIVFWVIVGPILIVIQMAQVEGPGLEPATDMTLVERLTLPDVAPVIALQLVLLAMLLLPQVSRRLGKWFLPLTLLLALIPLLIGYYWWPSENPLQTPFVIFFVVMLILIAWQFSFRYVLIYVLGLSFYQFWLAMPASDVPLSVHLGWLALQGSMMLLVGYVVVQLVSIQREQRAALAEAYEQQAAANARLQQYAATIEELSISRERNRLARELHDTLAHSLSAVTVQLEAVRSLWQVKPESARDLLDQADETARTGLTEARRALRALRASPLQDLGLVLALRDLAETAAERAGASLELRVSEHLSDRLAGHVPLELEQGVYRVAQEALENVVRHAEARHIVVCLEQQAQNLVMCIEDDGVGTDGEKNLPPGENQVEGRLGIRGMQERAQLIGGRLEIASRPEQGTTVTLSVPL
jgi:signal transduction histidine kinase